jgi:trimethylamine--corrinoid protein Co-methyltransferase
VSYYEVLSSQNIADIHEASLEVLHKTGFVIEHKVALKKLSDAGAQVNFENNIARFSPEVVENALKAVPEQFLLAGRSPEFDITVTEDGFPYLRAPGGPDNYYDAYKNQVRPLTLQDVYNTAKLVDALEHIALGGTLSPQDIPPETYDIATTGAVLSSCRKHFWCLTTSSKNLRYQLEMAQIVAGGVERVAKRPPFSGIICILEPLRFTHDEIERLMLYGKYNLPVRVPIVPSAGANAPYTLAGTMTQFNAEVLGAVVVLQTICPGIPAFYYLLSQILDMRNGATRYCTPETMLLYSAACQLCRHYRLPAYANACQTNTSQIHQAMFMRGFGFLNAALSGAVELSPAGVLEGSKNFSPQMMIIDNELMAFTKRYINGIEVNQGTLAVEAINRVGHFGHHLDDSHTMQYLRQEARFTPELLDTRTFDVWREDFKTIIDRAQEKMQDILHNHHVPPLEEKVQTELDKIFQAAKAELGR